MSYSSHQNNALLFLNALEQILSREGFRLKPDVAVDAGEKAYASSRLAPINW
jgi:hypothetical protein